LLVVLSRKKARPDNSRARRYFGWRELIAVLSSLLTLAHGVAVLCPGFVPYLPAARLTNPVLFVRLIGGEMQLFLGAFNRVRRCLSAGDRKRWHLCQASAELLRRATCLSCFCWLSTHRIRYRYLRVMLR
jgi:hypothetical protein